MQAALEASIIGHIGFSLVLIFVVWAFKGYIET